jgi:hypothetical protein
MIAPLGIMGGRLALGDAGGVSELRDGAAIFTQGRVPITRGARLSKIRESSFLPRRKRAFTVGNRSSVPVLARMQAAFAAEIAAGRDTWLTFTIMIDRALGVRVDDFEGDFIRGRALSVIRKRTARLGASHSILWAMERDRHRGLHVHGLAHATSDNHCQMRQVIREGFGSACEADIQAPAFKFHTPVHRVAGPAEAGGWWAYSLSGLVAPGVEVSGIRGKPGCVPLTVKPVGVSRARGNA